MAYRWKPSKAAAREFAAQMQEITDFCAAHGIERSRAGDSYYFSVAGQKYRVSNHSVESSRAEYHPNGREEDTIYIHSGKTRIMDVYNDLCAGYQLDGRGRRRS